MGITSLGGSGISIAELSETGKDTNAIGTVTAALDVGDYNMIFMQVVNESGGSSSHKVNLQVSANGTDWNAAGSSVTGENSLDNIAITARYVRLRVKVAEGSASISTLILQAKRI